MENITIEEKIRLSKIYLDSANDENKINKIFDICRDNYIDNKEIQDRSVELKTNKKDEIELKNKHISNEKNIIIVKTTPNLDKNSYKYTIFLKLLNKILVSNEIGPIYNIYEFKNMTKDQLIKDKEANNLFGMEKDIFKKGEGFD